jgi:Cu2+-exporting ATPase
MITTAAARLSTPAPAAVIAQDPSAFVTLTDGRKALHVIVRGAKCASCLGRIEGTVGRLPGVETARLNLSTGKLHVVWRGGLAPRKVIEAVTELGYGASAFDPGVPDTEKAREERALLVALAVGGLGTAGVMFLSEPMWFGSDMDAGTQLLFRWLAALIAIPVSVFSGWTFFRSAGNAIQHRQLNMDVPISLAVILSLALSVHATATDGQHTYFDAAVMLLFFLLIGRFLDARLRRRAYAAANALAAMQTASVTRLDPRGQAEAVRASQVRPGDMLLVSAGERLVVDAEVISGTSDVDLRLVTGEIEPKPTFIAQTLHAGAVNLSAALRVRALSPADRSLMADVGRLLEAGEQKKSAYRRIADRVAAAYVPQVHAMAAIGFLAWLFMGAGVAQAAFVAVTVLIITCPCALGLAAPLVQVVTAGRLFRKGIYLGSGDALERIAAVDHVVFDKTGTLTMGDPVLLAGTYSQRNLQEAAQLARASRHPFSRALVAAAGKGPVAQQVREHPGQGVAGVVGGRRARLGQAEFVGAGGGAKGLWFGFEGEAPVAFAFEDQIRDGARLAIKHLRGLGCEVELLSGDTDDNVARAAQAAGIARWTANATPQSKAAHLAALEASGKKVLMIGDGLNDAGALANAHAALAPGGALDVSRLAADAVYSNGNPDAVVDTIRIARAARNRMRENFALAAAYNLVAIPVALAGWATPIVAALAMSASSAVVTLNALRMQGGRISP